MQQHFNTRYAMVILGILFFLFGFVTWLNGSLIPYLKELCNLNDFEALFVTFAFYISYTVLAFPMAAILERTGYKKGMQIGLGIISFGMFLFIPAAYSGNFLFFLVALFSLGTGLTILQTASNPYIVLLGDQKSAARRISIMGLINKFAGVLAPLLFSAVVFDQLSQNDHLDPFRLALPYFVMGCAVFVLMLFVKFSSLQEIAPPPSTEQTDKKKFWEFPHLTLGAIALFFYVGVEVLAGDTIGLYAQSLGMQHATALTSYTMFFMVLGYSAGVVLIPRYLSQQKALLLSALLGLVFTIGIVWGDTKSTTVASYLWGWSSFALLPNSVVYLALLGFANALVWPSIWPLALRDLGEHTAKGSALLIMAIAGGALIPLVFGYVSDILGSMQEAYSIVFVLYGIIAYYALDGYKR